jgi:hypothetical protein
MKAVVRVQGMMRLRWLGRRLKATSEKNLGGGALRLKRND